MYTYNQNKNSYIKIADSLEIYKISTSIDLQYNRKVIVNFIEFSRNAVMYADEWTNPLLGGGPMKGWPMRAETFYVNQGKFVGNKSRNPEEPGEMY